VTTHSTHTNSTRIGWLDEGAALWALVDGTASLEKEKRIKKIIHNIPPSSPPPFVPFYFILFHFLFILFFSSLVLVVVVVKLGGLEERATGISLLRLVSQPPCGLSLTGPIC